MAPSIPQGYCHRTVAAPGDLQLALKAPATEPIQPELHVRDCPSSPASSVSSAGTHEAFEGDPHNSSAQFMHEQSSKGAVVEVQAQLAMELKPELRQEAETETDPQACQGPETDPGPAVAKADSGPKRDVECKAGLEAEPAKSEQEWLRQLPCWCKCVKRAILRTGFGRTTAKCDVVEVGETIQLLEYRRDPCGIGRVRSSRGWASVVSSITGEALFEAKNRRMRHSAGSIAQSGPCSPRGTSPSDAEEKEPGDGGHGDQKPRFQGRHLEFLKQLAASRRAEQQKGAKQAEVQASRRMKLQQRVLQRCRDLGNSVMQQLPPQQKALLAAAEANSSILRDRTAKLVTRTSFGRRPASVGRTQRVGFSTLLAPRFTQTFSFGEMSRCAASDGSRAGDPHRDVLQDKEPRLHTGVAEAERRGQTARAREVKRVGRATVIFDDDCDAEWNVQQHSLQRRMAPTNSDEEKLRFFANNHSTDPQFQYSHQIEAHQLERFPVCKRWVVEAEKLLNSIITEFGSEKEYQRAMTKRRKTIAANSAVDGQDPNTSLEAMTPEELVVSAENFLRSCLLPHHEGVDESAAMNSLVEQLTIHFSHRKTRAMSVKGTILNVPLPITLSRARADTVWYHELGTHFLRNAINQPQRIKLPGAPGRQLALMVPFGAQGGAAMHLARLEKARKLENRPLQTRHGNPSPAIKVPSRLRKTLGEAQSKYMNEKPATKQCNSPNADSNRWVPQIDEEAIVINKATVRTGYSLDSEEAQFGRLEVGEVIKIIRVVDPAAEFPCPFVCVKRTVLRKGKHLGSERIGHIEEGENVIALEESSVENRRRVRCAKGWLSVTGAEDTVFLSCVASQPRVCFERAGAKFWVSTATPERRPLLIPHTRQQSATATRSNWNTQGSSHGTKGERVAAHVREKEEHTSEEGTAIVNQYLVEPDQRLWRPALMYVAAAKAWETSFVELWKYLGRWVENPDKRWNICVRVKGGLRDTSKAGGFCRDQAYWAGALQLLQARDRVDFKMLHSGRIGIDEATQEYADPSPALPHAVLPPFLRDLYEYKQKLNSIAAANFIS